ncbi:MAG: alpha-hydroxy acid oxidase [Rhodospirillaceae bacterium]
MSQQIDINKLPTPVFEQFETLHEFAKKAKQNLAQNDWDYLMGAAETETTCRRNRQALDTLAFRPRVLRDVETVDCGTTFLGQRLRLPVVLAPIGSMQDFHPDAGAAPTKAAAEFGCLHMLSSVCLPGLEKVAEAAPGYPKVYQLYVRGDSDFVDDHAKRAIDNGYIAFAFTVDLDYYSRRERDLAKRHRTTGRRLAGYNEEHQKRFSWDDVKRFQDKFDIPVIIKGIATAEDAAIAAEQGVDVVYVSNHGGRQLDHGRGGLDVLPEVVAACKGKSKVMFDGGIMRGADLVKAMALGADAVGMGRFQGMAVAAGGAEGLVRALEILEGEVRSSLGMLGVTGYHELDASYVHAAPQVREPHVLSCFPLLEEGY